MNTQGPENPGPAATPPFTSLFFSSCVGALCWAQVSAGCYWAGVDKEIKYLLQESGATLKVFFFL